MDASPRGAGLPRQIPASLPASLAAHESGCDRQPTWSSAAIGVSWLRCVSFLMREIRSCLHVPVFHLDGSAAGCSERQHPEPVLLAQSQNKQPQLSGSWGCVYPDPSRIRNGANRRKCATHTKLKLDVGSVPIEISRGGSKRLVDKQCKTLHETIPERLPPSV